jgi:hypothetical protein
MSRPPFQGFNVSNLGNRHLFVNRKTGLTIIYEKITIRFGTLENKEGAAV